MLTTAANGMAAEPAPETVSPGSEEGTVIDDRCPTFDWGGVVGASGLELVVYRVDGSDEPELVLRRELPGSATGWTPALPECLRRGGGYAWTVRVRGGADFGGWAPLRLFDVAPSPTGAERLGGEPAGPARGREARSRVAPAADPRRDSTGRRALERGRPKRSRVAGPIVSPPSFRLAVSGDVKIQGGLYKSDGGGFVHEPGIFNLGVGVNTLDQISDGESNTAVGWDALVYNTVGSFNTAMGDGTLINNTEGDHMTALGYRSSWQNETGSRNTAVGSQSLWLNEAGGENSAVGYRALAYNKASLNSAFGASALRRNSTGYQNTAVGHAALRDNTYGKQNTAVGQAALLENETGNYNTAVGEDALRFATGSRNIALGRYAGRTNTAGNDNIFIGNQGAANESKTIRIGVLNFHEATYLAGINNSTVSDVGVMVDTATGRLGISTSSRRFKEGIRDLGATSRKLMDLRPVSFRRKAEAGPDGSRLEFGLVAEEVAEVLPELVVEGGDGSPFTVRYHQLAPLLLNELQRQERRLRIQGWILVALAGAWAGSWWLGRRPG